MPPLSTYTLTDRAPLRAHKVKLQPFASPPAQEVKPIIDDRIAKLRDFASLLESRMASLPCVADYNVIVAACRELIATLQNVSMQEIQTNKTSRANQDLLIMNASLRKQNDKLKAQYASATTENAEQLAKIKDIEAQLFMQQQKSLSDRKIIEDLSRRVSKQDKRLQLSLETNLYAHRDSLKNTLQDLIMENETQKKIVLNQSKEMERLQHYLNLANDKVQRLQKKVNSMHHINLEHDEGLKQGRSLAFTEIPQTFDFRYQFLSPEFRAFISTLSEHSADEYYQQFQFNDADKKRQQITWLYTQNLNLMEFMEKQNFFFQKLNELLMLKSVDELVHYVRGFNTLFNVLEINLWVRDNSTGFLETISSNNEKKRVQCTTGLFRDCLDTMQAQNRLAMQNFVVYHDQQGKEVHQNRSYVIPLRTDTLKPGALLEFTRLSDRFSNINSDLQYFASILATFTTFQLNAIENSISRQYQTRCKDLLSDEFIKLCRASSRLAFVRQVQEMQQHVFCLSTSDIVFIEHPRLRMSKYLANDTLKSFDGCLGVTGQIVMQKTPSFFKQIAQNTNFNDQVDIASLLPIYMYPIVKRGATTTFNDRDVVVAVLQLTVSNRHLRRHKFKDTQNYLQSTDNEVKVFCDFVGTAYQLLNYI